MRASSPALLAYLQSRQPVFSADLMLFSFANATTLGLTTADVPVVWNGVTYHSGNGNPLLTRSPWEIKHTIEVPRVDVQLFSTGADFAGGNIKLLAHNGLFDGCHLLFQRAYWTQRTRVPLGSVILFGGRTGPAEINAEGIKITFKGDNVRMEQDFPTRIFTASCIHTLYDSGCKLNRAASTFNGVVSSASAINVNWEADPSNGHFNRFLQGVMTFTSGVAEGNARTIGNAAEVGVLLLYPLYEIPAPGDTFTICYGCAKTMAYCETELDNLDNFLGFPFVPPAELGF